MPLQSIGGRELAAELEAQAARMENPQPALDAADADLAEVRRLNPEWNTPGSWYTRTLARIERWVKDGLT